MSFIVRVPASSANLGPGFDCLGLALDLWNEVEITETGDRIELEITGEGAGVLPANEDNAIITAMRRYARQEAIDLPAGLKLVCRNAIPLGSGLGSSAAAAVAGILIASGFSNEAPDHSAMLACATAIEGHPDNAAACLYGGLVAAMSDKGQPLVRCMAAAPLALAIAVPSFDFPTHQARAALPKTVSLNDAVFNLSHAVMVVEALRSGDLDLLASAMQDHLHQPYRLALIPGAEQVVKSAFQAGAAAVALSGAGPSIMAVARQPEDAVLIAGSMVAAFKQAGLSARAFTPHISNLGAQVSKK
jgi:homoserine kinase